MIELANPNRLPAMSVANRLSSESALCSCACSASGETSTPNHRLVYSLMVLRMSGAAWIKALSCSTTNGIINATIATVSTASPSRISPVAMPRRIPRFASHATAGSRANDANRATNAQISRSLICRKNARKTMEASAMPAMTKSRVTIQRHEGGSTLTRVGWGSSRGAGGSFTEISDVRTRGGPLAGGYPDPFVDPGNQAQPRGAGSTARGTRASHDRS